MGARDGPQGREETMNRGPKVHLEDVVALVESLSKLIPFFPQDLLSKRIIAAEFHKFIGDQAQYDWFAQACVSKFTKWEGIPLFRALYNTRFAPDDGQAPSVELPGFSTDELEAKYRAREIEENERRLAEYKQQALAEPENAGAFPLPESKRIQ